MAANQYALARIPIIDRPCGYYLRWWYSGWHYWQFLQGGLSMVTEGEKYRTRGTRVLQINSGVLIQSQIDGLRTILNSTEIYLFTDFGWVMVRVDNGSVKVFDNKVPGYEITLSVVIGSRLPSVTGFSPFTPVPIVPPNATQCELIIGLQIWMCEAYAAMFPGSFVYMNDENNRVSYRGLYTWDQVKSPGFVPEGWRVATIEDWNALIDFVGDNTDAGGILKDAGYDHWDAPNTDAVDSVGMSVKGMGYMSPAGASLGMFTVANIWAADQVDAVNAYAIQMSNTTGAIIAVSLPKDYRLSTWLIKNDPYVPVPITYSSWFLPSKDELQAMYDQLKLYSVGGLSDLSYWSSTETSSIYASSLAFGDGTENVNTLKGDNRCVRAVRTFTTATVYSLRDIGPGGGLIFHIIDNGSDYTYYEANSVDQSVVNSWSNVASTEIGLTAQGAGIGDGVNNTIAIISQAGHTDSAAKLCNDLI